MRDVRVVHVKVTKLSSAARHPTGNIADATLVLSPQGFKEFTAALTAFLLKYEAYMDDRS